MAHKFDPENMHVLDMEERKKIFPPEKALAAAKLKEGDALADIGCGAGYLSIPATAAPMRSCRACFMKSTTAPGSPGLRKKSLRPAASF